MNILIIVGENPKSPKTLINLLEGEKTQPIEVDEILDEDDISELIEYIDSLNYKHIYVLFSNEAKEYQSLEAIKESTIKVDAFFTTF